MKVLKNNYLQSLLDEDGYVVLDMLSENEIRNYLQEYEDVKSQLTYVNDIHITIEHAQLATRKYVAERLIQMSLQKFSEVFDNCKLFQGSFIIKAASSNSNAVGLHQDWNFVDESNGLESYTLWIALCDITENMGTVGVIAGSHKQLNDIRYSPKEKYFDNYSSIVAYAQDKTIKNIELKAGQAILWNHRLMHNSPPNFSNKTRTNVAFGITNKNAQMKLFWLSPESQKIMEFNVPDDFYFTVNSSMLYDYYLACKTPESAISIKGK